VCLKPIPRAIEQKITRPRNVAARLPVRAGRARARETLSGLLWADAVYRSRGIDAGGAAP
jgi:hypothetical protein